jgi:hypothetical protein
VSSCISFRNVSAEETDETSYIKLYKESGSTLHGDSLPTPGLELQTAVVEAAHSHGLITIAHALSLEDTLTVLKAGTDGMAHTFYDKAPTEELLEAYKKNNAFLIPTLCASATIIGEESESSKKHIGHELAEKVLDESGKTCFGGRMKIAKEGCKAEFAHETVKMVKKHGLDIIWFVLPLLFVLTYLSSKISNLILI